MSENKIIIKPDMLLEFLKEVELKKENYPHIVHVCMAAAGRKGEIQERISPNSKVVMSMIECDMVKYAESLEKHGHLQKQWRESKSRIRKVNNSPKDSPRDSLLDVLPHLPTYQPTYLSNNLSNKREKRVCFVIPSFEEVKNEFAKIDPSLNAKEQAEKFCDHYSANGWKVGSSSMKDWKAAARNWARRTKNFGAVNNSSHNTKQPISVDYKEEGYDLGDWGKTDEDLQKN